jgi:hypothetical protein
MFETRKHYLFFNKQDPKITKTNYRNKNGYNKKSRYGDLATVFEFVNYYFFQTLASITPHTYT